HGQRCGDHRGHLRVAGHRPPAVRGHLPARLSAGAGRGGHGGVHDRRHQPVCGHPVRLHPSADPTLQMRETMATIPANTPPVSPRAAARRPHPLAHDAPAGPPVAVGLPGGAIVIALLGDVIAPYDRTVPVRDAEMFRPPFWMDGGRLATPLGTDFQGRDILSRLVYGARVSLIVGLMGTLVAGGLGTAMGI